MYIKLYLNLNTLMCIEAKIRNTTTTRTESPTTRTCDACTFQTDSKSQFM